MIMGCYGIGVTRTLQSAIEQSHDDAGIVWPVTVAPYEVEVLVLNAKDEESSAVAEQLGEAIERQGFDVLFDDRKERPGVKFKDADLLGIPVRVAVGERSLAEGVVEVKLRRSDEVLKVPVGEVAERVGDIVRGLIAEVQG